MRRSMSVREFRSVLFGLTIIVALVVVAATLGGMVAFTLNRLARFWEG
jgi:uncharacterized membrane protein